MKKENNNKEKIGNINYELRVFKVKEDDDPRFLKAIISVCHDGWNRNNSYMSLDVIKETAEKSLRGTPVTGFLKYDEEGNADFAGHEEEIIITEEGEIGYKYLGSAFGYVHHNADFWYEDKTFNGQERTYLMTEVILWKKFEHTKVFMESPDKFHSMELQPDNYTIKWAEELEGRSGHEFTEMMFDAFCILGDTVPPAMIGSAMKQFEKSFNATNFKQMMEDTDKIIEENNGGGTKLSKNKTGKDFELSYEEKRDMISNFLSSNVEGFWGGVNFDSENVSYSIYDYDSDKRKMYLAKYSIGSEGEATVDTENAKEAVFKIMAKENEQEAGMLVGFSALAEKFEITLKENFDTKAKEKQEKIKAKDVVLAYEINEMKDELKEFAGTKEEFESAKEKLTKLESDLAEAEQTLEKFEIENSKFRKKEKLKEIENVVNLPDEVKEKLIERIDEFTLATIKDELIREVGKMSIKYSVENDMDDIDSNPIRNFSKNNKDGFDEEDILTEDEKRLLKIKEKFSTKKEEK